MKTAQFLKIKEREKQNKLKLLEVNPFLTDESGIYVFAREDENGFRYAYIGQAKHVLTRLAQHLEGHEQWIDLSIKKHKLWSESNPYGWFVSANHVEENRLNERETRAIKAYADMGYQLRNKTSGSQGKGKIGIAENKPSKGYRDGIRQGRCNLSNELQKLLKYVVIAPKDEKELTLRMYNKFLRLTAQEETEVNNGE